jgi:preprotein translocase subunit SecF
MRPLHLVPADTNVPFMRWRYFGLGLSVFGFVASIILLLTVGLNFGIDFRGGILVEVRTEGPADLEAMRSTLGNLGLGEISLQTFGESDDVLIRIQRQEGGDAEQQAAVERLRQGMASEFGDIQYRRVEFVGPQVSDELIEKGVTAVALAVGAMLIYVWLRFEWQFGIGAVLALIHDVALTLGLFSLLQLDFGLSIVAAV